MAQLTEGQRNALHRELMRYMSSGWIECNLSKSQLRTAIDTFDEGLEAAETSILNNVTPAQRAWLLNNVTLARWIMDNVAQARTEAL